MRLGLRKIFGWLMGVGATLGLLAGASLAMVATIPLAEGSSLPAPEASPGLSDVQTISADRAAALRYMLIQDCGSCHGLSLGGGLGPALQHEQVANKPVEYLAYTILNGRPGTAMPPWSRFLSEQEGQFLARELRGENP